MPRGRPITNNSPLAQYKREWTRKRRAEMRATDNLKASPQPLQDAINNWNRNDRPVRTSA